MPLRHEPDVSHAAWLTESDLYWVQLSCFGPDEFEASVRLFHGDPDGEPDDDLESCEGDLSVPQLKHLTGILAGHTGTPDTCFFALWDGFGGLHGSPSVGVLVAGGKAPEVAPAFGPEVMAGPRVRIPARDYLLFRGRLPDAGAWGALDLAPGFPRDLNSPNLMWPADHAWFVATEIDLPWTAISGTAELIDDVLASGLDVELIEPSPTPPYGRSA